MDEAKIELTVDTPNNGGMNEEKLPQENQELYVFWCKNVMWKSCLGFIRHPFLSDAV